MTDLQFIITEDGSHTLFRADLDETYHSKHGALQESQHVFINNGLRYWMETRNKEQVTIFEVGFGTGLNAWLTHQLATEQKLQVRYFSVEAFPLQPEVWKELNYAPDDRTFKAIHEASWNVSVPVSEYFTLHKLEGKLEDVSLPELTDIVYFDAFAPAKQPELWTYSVLEKACVALDTNGVFVTYCAKGQLKRDLRSLGLRVETLPGPPGKKEMVRAIRL
ncbi:tRNA (5-methylaminomethyl-2-thiouridine)(34)-methyltransferase MnmD [Chryseolinea sp. T2]|uniref:tRNA (5-methylaminomethyl-2-thiouridine)(34)-methyltransferase MnmD n=1 Tax=Chryseolinea sp. T2 TaxID=3129255 RepID=UPI003076E155